MWKQENQAQEENKSEAVNCDLVLDFKQSGWLLASPYYMRYSTTSTLVNASLLELVSRARWMSHDEEHSC